MNVLNLIGRTEALFNNDLEQCEEELKQKISNSSFLILGGAGSIGQAVAKEIFQRNPKLIHVVEVENPNTKKKNEVPIEGLQSFFG